MSQKKITEKMPGTNPRAARVILVKCCNQYYKQNCISYTDMPTKKNHFQSYERKYSEFDEKRGVLTLWIKFKASLFQLPIAYIIQNNFLSDI